MEGKLARGLIAVAVFIFAVEVVLALSLIGAFHRTDALHRELAELQSRSALEIKAFQKRIDGLPKPPTAEAVSLELRDKVAAEAIDRVAKLLVETPSYRTLLRGEKGEPGDDGDDAAPPRLDDVVNAVLAKDPEAINSKIAERIASSAKVLEDRRLIAAVAQAVYERYSKELRGVDGANGQSPDPAQIAELIAGDLRFADLVSQLIPHR